MLRKIVHFWREPLLNKVYHLGTAYYKAKGFLLYRLLFADFGNGSYIRRPLLILYPNFIQIGKKVGIRDGVRLEIVPSGIRVPSLAIGDNTNIEQNVHIVCRNRVHIGSNVSITANCAIVDVTHPFEDVSDPNKIGSRVRDDESFVEIGDGAFLGFGTVVLPGVRIGSKAVIGANSVVVRDVPDYSVAAGVPAVVKQAYDFAKQEWTRVPAADKREQVKI